MHNTSNGSLIIRRHLEPPDYMFEWSCQRRPLRRVRRKTKRDMDALLVVRRNTGQTSAQTSTKKPGQDSKSVNVTLRNNDGASGYGGLTLGQYSCVCWCVFVFWQHINTKSTGMLRLILVELHKMFRWFVSSIIILHHAQYIEWFSNHSSSPWATGLSDDKLMTNPARSTIIGITYFEWEKLFKV